MDNNITFRSIAVSRLATPPWQSSPRPIYNRSQSACTPHARRVLWLPARATAIMSEILETERHGRVLHLILNRPEKRNALSAQLCRDLTEAFEDADRDPQVGAILL